MNTDTINLIIQLPVYIVVTSFYASGCIWLSREIVFPLILIYVLVTLVPAESRGGECQESGEELSKPGQRHLFTGRSYLPYK